MQQLQSEHPRLAKKAEENKIQAKPVPRNGWAMAVARKEDEQLEARASNVEDDEGEGSGYFSQFLHDWCQSVLATYRGPSGSDESGPCYMNVGYENGHVTDVQRGQSCGSEAVSDAFAQAIFNAPRPPMPTSFGNRHISLIFRLSPHARS